MKLYLLLAFLYLVSFCFCVFSFVYFWGFGFIYCLVSVPFSPCILVLLTVCVYGVYLVVKAFSFVFLCSLVVVHSYLAFSILPSSTSSPLCLISTWFCVLSFMSGLCWWLEVLIFIFCYTWFLVAVHKVNYLCFSGAPFVCL